MTDAEHCECGCELPADAAACPECGRRVGGTSRGGSRGLWDVMRQAGALEETVQIAGVAEDERTGRGESATGEALPLLPSAVRCLVFGAMSIPLGVLALRAEPWANVPGPLAGLIGVVFGFVALTELRSRRVRRRGTRRAILGMACGVLGMFLGPLLLSDVGNEWRERAARERVLERLTTIGRGLDAYHAEQGHYPPGGTFSYAENGNLVPRHGWMTALLPFVGEEALHGRIDPAGPYDAPENLEAMRTVVPGYRTVGMEATHSRRGFGLAGFAGLGGDLEDEEHGLRSIGIFNRNSQTRAEEITDGAANTLIVGEVASDYPEWGEPGNWRRIGEGLNRVPDGFGNAAGTGAFFLKADGSVRFFSNRTSPEVLRALSTRDGGETIEGW